MGRKIVDSGEVSMKIGIRLRSNRWDGVLGRDGVDDGGGMLVRPIRPNGYPLNSYE